ncbi:hypothetical protein EV424DRAFT_1404766 [Suillus variegatus]|nr:hypothetical protein EV424DRAFT_1404766 [Suillus variegatus]
MNVSYCIARILHLLLPSYAICLLSPLWAKYLLSPSQATRLQAVRSLRVARSSPLAAVMIFTPKPHQVILFQSVSGCELDFSSLSEH